MHDRYSFLSASSLIFVSVLLPGICHADEIRVLAETSRELIRIYSEKLEFEYNTTIKTENNKDLNQVCRVKAPDIASGLSVGSWSIRRTALTTLNDDNSPDSFERRILRDFEDRQKEGKSIDQLSYYKLTEAGNESEFIYLKAIAAEQFCLSCHGQILPGDKNTISNPTGQDNPDNLKSEFILGAYSVKYRQLKNHFQEQGKYREKFALPEYQEISD